VIESVPHTLRTAIATVPTITTSHGTGAAITPLAAIASSGSLPTVAAVLHPLGPRLAVFAGFSMAGRRGAILAIRSPGTRLGFLGPWILRTKGWTADMESQKNSHH